jgi:hypothetical protein
MINLSIALKKYFKNQNQFKSKNQLKLIYVFSQTLKVKNTWYELSSLNGTIWPKYRMCLVAWIGVNNTFLSLPL